MRLNYLITLVGAFGFLIGCSHKIDRNVESPRVVSLVPSVTETIFALCAEDHLLAVTTYCTYPEEARSLPKVGNLTSPSYERIVEIEPDIVYVTLPLQRKIYDDLTRLGIFCVDVSPESFDEILLSIGEIAVHLGKSGAGDTLVSELREASEREMGARIDPPVSVYMELSDRPLYTAGGRSFIDEILEAAGARNVFREIDQGYFVTSTEDVLNRAPEIIVVLHEAEDGVENRLGWSEIPAVRNGRIVKGLDFDLLSRPGPRFVRALQTLREAMNEVLDKDKPERPSS